MKTKLENKKLNRIKADLELIFIVKGRLGHKWVRSRDFESQKFKGETNQVIVAPGRKRAYVGIDSLEHENLRVAAGLASRALEPYKFRSLKIGLYGDSAENAKAIVEGFILGSYKFEKYKSKKKKHSLIKVIISSEEYENKKINLANIETAIGEGKIISQAVNFSRDLVNLPPSELHPLKLSDFAKSIAKENKLGIKVYGEKFLEKENMGAFLAVSKASPYPPQLIHLTYKPKDPKAKIFLVGKGLTYDTGGLSLKPSEHMRTMKADESGASAILGIMQAVAKLELPLEIHGVIGATENIIGRHAYKPDDILKAKNGKTIEIKNTDAEGRLVLADCLSYAQEFRPDYIIDLATLTGACIVALGEYTIGVMGNNKALKEEFLEAAQISGELAADLPFNRYLRELLKSEVADISNLSSSKYGGAVTAALFLAEFIKKKYQNKWIHLDIAGPAFIEKPWSYNPYGASGAGVRLIITWLKNFNKTS